MRGVITLGCVALAVATSSVAHAHSHHHHHSHSRSSGAGSRGQLQAPLSFELAVGAYQPSLADRELVGSGLPRNGGGLQTVRSDGRAAGFDRPLGWGFQLRILALAAPYFVVGGRVGGFFGKADRASTRPLGSSPLGDTYSGFLIAPEVGTAFAVGRFEVAATIAVGYRRVEVPMLGLVRIPCGKHASCASSASDESVFVEPRLALGLRVTRTFAIGAYVAGELVPAPSLSAGAYLALRLPDWGARTNVLGP